MKLLYNTPLVLAALVAVDGAVVQKRNSNSWAGSNNYLLPGLPSKIQDQYISTLADGGAKVVRVWVNSQPGSGCEKGEEITHKAPELENTIGDYNRHTLKLLDSTIHKIANAGMKVIISPHDANLLDGPNGNDIYGQTYGSGDFYTSATAAAQYDARLKYILNYVSPSSGLAWKDWTDAIMAFDIENEPMSVDGKASYGDPTGWMCARANTIRSTLGADSPIKVASGGVGGDYSHGYNFANFVTSCGQIDLLSVHRYANGGWDNPDWISDAKGKLVYVEEWGIAQGSDQGSEYESNTSQMDGQGLPWMYWQVLPEMECALNPDDSDHFAVYQGASINIAAQMQAAASVEAAQDWTGIVYS